MPHFTEARLGPSRGAALVTLDGRPYPLESAKIAARAEGGLAQSTLIQMFRNPYQESLEVLYTLPLPADGVVIGYTARIGQRVIRGEIEKREAARESYAQALAEGRATALLEQDRDDTFNLRLGSIPAGQPASVEIDILHPLGFVPAEGAGAPRWEYRFPTVVGVRYEGAPERVTDADRLDVDRAAEGEIPTRIELDLTVADGSPDAVQAASATHDIRCEAEGAATRVSLRAGARLDRDLVLRWNACAERAGVRIVEGSGMPGDSGRYALLTLTPPANSSSALARDLTVLIDASGSMSGEPLQAAKLAVAGLLQGLESGDRFEVIAFASTAKRLTRGLLPASPASLRKALESLDHLQAGGATEMARALIDVLDPLRVDSQRQVVLVTDGYIGFESQVVGEILRRLPANARVHAVGVGAAPTRSLTQAAARAGRGIEVFAHDPTSATEAGRRLVRATARPVLTELSVAGDAVRGVAPERPRDVLANQPLVLALELRETGGTIEVSGRQAGNRETWVWRVELPATDAEPTGTHAPGAVVSRTPLPLGALFGREQVADLELQRAAATEAGPTLDTRIEQSALRHGIASRLTSLVAVAEEPLVDPRLPRRRERLPVEVPQGVSAEGAGLVTYQVSGVPTMQILGTAPMRGRFEMLHGLGKAVKWAVSPPKLPTPVRPIEVRIVGHFLELAEDRCVVEFTAPFKGFVLPEGEINLWLDGARWLLARVVPEESTARGPHPARRAVRLTLVIMGRHPEWRRVGWIDLRWLAHPEGRTADRARRQVTLHVAVPSVLTEPR